MQQIGAQPGARPLRQLRGPPLGRGHTARVEAQAQLGLSSPHGRALDPDVPDRVNVRRVHEPRRPGPGERGQQILEGELRHRPVAFGVLGRVEAPYAEVEVGALAHRVAGRAREDLHRPHVADLQVEQLAGGEGAGVERHRETVVAQAQKRAFVAPAPAVRAGRSAPQAQARGAVGGDPQVDVGLAVRLRAGLGRHLCVVQVPVPAEHLGRPHGARRAVVLLEHPVPAVAPQHPRARDVLLDPQHPAVVVGTKPRLDQAPRVGTGAPRQGPGIEQHRLDATGHPRSAGDDDAIGMPRARSPAPHDEPPVAGGLEREPGVGVRVGAVVGFEQRIEPGRHQPLQPRGHGVVGQQRADRPDLAAEHRILTASQRGVGEPDADDLCRLDHQQPARQPGLGALRRGSAPSPARPRTPGPARRRAASARTARSDPGSGPPPRADTPAPTRSEPPRWSPAWSAPPRTRRPPPAGWSPSAASSTGRRGPRDRRARAPRRRRGRADRRRSARSAIAGPPVGATTTSACSGERPPAPRTGAGADEASTRTAPAVGLRPRVGVHEGHRAARRRPGAPRSPGRPRSSPTPPQHPQPEHDRRTRAGPSRHTQVMRWSCSGRSTSLTCSRGRGRDPEQDSRSASQPTAPSTRSRPKSYTTSSRRNALSTN